MSITKKDTIVLTVLFNIVVLACILATARQAPQLITPHQVRERDVPRVVVTTSATKTAPDESLALDEIDELLEDYISTTPSQGTRSNKPEKTAAKKDEKKAFEGLPSDAFYVVKPGDNPWKIAKKFHLSFDKLLELNDLDEVKARNLKVGQTLKIRETT